MDNVQDLSAHLHVGYIVLIIVVFGAGAIWVGWCLIKFIGNLFGFTKREPKLKNANELR